MRAKERVQVHARVRVSVWGEDTGKGTVICKGTSQGKGNGKGTREGSRTVASTCISRIWVTIFETRVQLWPGAMAGVSRIA